MHVNRRHLFLTAWLCLTFSACDRLPKGTSRAADAAPIQLCYLAAREDHPYEAIQMRLLTSLAATNDRVRLKSESANGKSAVQIDQFRQALASKPKIILIAPVDSAAMRAQVSQAITAGVIVIGLGEAARDLPCTTVLNCDQKQLGTLAGAAVLRALKLKAESEGKTEPEGRVVQIYGDDESPLSARRSEGFLEALHAAPGVVLVHDAPGFWTQKGGLERTRDALRLQHSFDVVYAHNDAMARGASEALKDRREEVLIIGTDGFRGTQGGLMLVGDGELDATVYQPLLVDYAWKIIIRLIKEPDFQLKPRYELPGHFISPKDINDIWRNGLPAFPEM